MHRVFHRLMRVLTGGTRNDLRHQVQFLKAENEILRSRLSERVRTTPQERRRLVRLGKPLGRSLRDLITIVKPATFLKWVNQARKPPRSTLRRRPGRPRTPDQVRELILRLARETDWGYTRILGELRKLGIKSVTRATVANTLKEHGIEPAPARGESTWDQFLRRHARTLWACDFVQQRVWTVKGVKDAFFLVFIHIKSRRVIATSATTQPDAAWMEAQARLFIQAAQRTPNPPRLLIRDRDSKFAASKGIFDGALHAAGVRTMLLPIRSPNLNAFAERFIKTLRVECLDRFVILGTSHLDHLLSEYVGWYYNQRRPHSSLAKHRAPSGPAPPEYPGLPRHRDIVCEERLGGLVKHFRQRAA